MPYFEAAIPVLCLAVNVTVQVLACRLVRPLGVLRSVMLGFVFGFVAFLMLEAYTGTQAPGQARAVNGYAMANFIIYAALGYCYFHFVNLGETARRIRILREIYEAGGALTMEEVLSRYGAREIVDMRLQRLLENGQIVYNDGRLRIGRPLVLVAARLMVFMKLILLGKKSEYD